MGVPAHPLLVHAAVVLVPLLALLTIAYALVPLVRPHVRWVLGLLAIATPLAALAAKLSGDAFLSRLQEKGRVSAEFLPRLEEHQDLGTMTLIVAVVLAILTLVLVYKVGPGVPVTGPAGATGMAKVLPLVLAVLSVVVAVVGLYYVIRTGDTGAKAVWEGS